MKTRWPLRRATMCAASSRARTIGARRLTASARSICSTVNSVSSPVPGSPALATSTSTGPRFLASRAPRVVGEVAPARPPRLGGDELEDVGAPAGQDEQAPPAQAPGDRVAEPTGRAGDEHAAPCQIPARPGKIATVAVKPCRKGSPPTGPISPAAKKPGRRRAVELLVEGVASWWASRTCRAAPVAGEDERSGGHPAAAPRAAGRAPRGGRGRPTRRRARAGGRRARSHRSADGERAGVGVDVDTPRTRKSPCS